MFILLLTFALAVDLPGEELFIAPPKVVQPKHEVIIEPQVPQPIEVPSSEVEIPHKSVTAKKTKTHEVGNLPTYFKDRRSSEPPISELIQKPTGAVDIFRGIQVGDSLGATISHSVIAFPDEKAPVIASLTEGSLRGVRLIGNSTLESNSRRIFINFDRIIINNQIYKISGQGLGSRGQPGIVGSYHSREAEYFAGDFISSFVAGYFDGLIPKKTNVFGEVQQDTSVDSAVKKGLASGALSSAERFREKLKKVPEFSEIKGPVQINILVLDQAKRE